MTTMTRRCWIFLKKNLDFKSLTFTEVLDNTKHLLSRNVGNFQSSKNEEFRLDEIMQLFRAFQILRRVPDQFLPYR